MLLPSPDKELFVKVVLSTGFVVFPNTVALLVIGLVFPNTVALLVLFTGCGSGDFWNIASCAYTKLLVQTEERGSPKATNIINNSIDFN